MSLTNTLFFKKGDFFPNFFGKKQTIYIRELLMTYMGEERKMDREIVTAKIFKVRLGGLNVRLPNGRKAWMPKREFSYDPEENNQLVTRFKEGYEIEVVVLGEGIGGEDVIASHRRVKKDPWKAIDNSWIGTERHIVVDSVTKHSAFGSIEAGVRGTFSFNNLDSYLNEQDPEGIWKRFRIVMPGDALMGTVEKIDRKNELIHLNIAEYLIQVKSEPERILGDLGEWRTLGGKQTSLPKSHAVRTSEINRILVVDDKNKFLNSIVENLQMDKYEVTGISSYGECVALLNEISSRVDPHDEYFDMAFIDINLTGRPSDLHGIDLAKLLKQEQPHCKIVLITGEQDEDKAAKIECSGDLKIEDYVYKPISPAELRHVIAEAAVTKSLPVANFLEYVSDSSKQTQEATERESIEEILTKLQKFYPQSTAILFRMYPRTLKVYIDAEVGDLPMRRERLQMLKYSPVRDCAIDGELIFNSNAQSRSLQPKHRWLLRTFCEAYYKDGTDWDVFKNSYRSCIGICIPMEADEYARCLFWFHGEESKFNPEVDKPRVEAYAIKIASQLDYDRLAKRITQESKFTISGKSHSSLGHELMTALNTAELSLDTLRKKLQSGGVNYDEIREAAETALERQQYASRIARTFRQLAKRKEITNVNVYKCLEEAGGKAKELVDEYPKNIKLRIGESPEEVIFMRADEIALTQMFFNLLLNAAQQIDAFIRDEGIVLAKVEKMVKEGREYARILISDTGPGIHAVNFQRVFEPMFTTKEDGTGMGLDICKGTIEDANGEIQVLSSTLFAGTTFEVLLPISSNTTDEGGNE